MWILEADPTGDLDDNLDRALTYANGAPVYRLSVAERAAVHVIYQLYDGLLGQPHPDLRPAALDGARLALQNAYSEVQKGGRLANLRRRLLASTDACPYCGFGEPRDLDHYLPQSVYGELAIYPNNLIPSCNPCNNAKRTVVPGLAPGAPAGFIHPYFETLPDCDFLIADVDYVQGSLRVAYRIDPPDLDPRLFAKLQFQIDRLKLNERYPQRINSFLSEQRTGILTAARAGEAVVRDFLAKAAGDMADDFGRNDWRVALLRALAMDVRFPQEPELYLGARRRGGG